MAEVKKPEPAGWDVVTRLLSGQQAAAPQSEPHLLKSETLFNRDLTWLEFNERVLSEAADPTVPALERLRFVTIVSSNLDEFFMVRVAQLGAVANRQPGHRFPDGLTAAQVCAQVREHVVRQKARQARVLRDVLEDLRRQGIRVDTRFGRVGRLDQLILESLPKLSVSIHRTTQPLPHLPSERIHVCVAFPGEYAIVTIEERQARLLRVPSKHAGPHFVLLERWLAARARRLFPGRDVLEAFPFKVIREADLRYRPDAEDTLEEQIMDAVHRRPKARVVRLEVDAPSYSEGSLSLATALRLDSGSLYRFNLPLDLRTLAVIYQESRYRPKLRYPPIVPQVPPPLRRKERIFETMRQRDILLHHPYDSFDSVLHFLQRAAEDPEVTRIYHTLYRTSFQSPIMEALAEAARRGKRVYVYVEIRARFDELNNLRWARELRRHGVRVIRPWGDLKVHSKATQVYRREGDREVSYLHLGTGNYHATTARQYTDLGLLTCDEQLGKEVSLFFGALIQHQKPSISSELLCAPLNMHRQIARLIEDEVAVQRAGGRGHIIAKMNALVDKEIIAKLYEASSAGVKVDLIVRGICCLRPGIRGLSENIRVVSVIDRFLEHSRVYYFRAGGSDKLYLSSADWMPRNFFTRFELAFPVKDPVLKRYIRDVILANSLADNVRAWHLRPDGSYLRPPPPPAGKEVRSQFLFESLAQRQYKDTTLADRFPAKGAPPAPPTGPGTAKPPGPTPAPSQGGPPPSRSP
ncbi:MAG: polyphosphate kinase 1 [Elusimicrobiota bacterium]